MQINQSADPLRSTYALEQFFADYRQAYKENLAGSENAVITVQLLSKNAKRIVFIDPRCAALHGAAPQSARRPVGHPIFLPRSGGQQMQVRSAGYDRQPWTAEDVFVDNSSPRARLF